MIYRGTLNAYSTHPHLRCLAYCKHRCLHCGLPADGDITGVGRRRSWPSEEKVRLVGEVAERGVAEVARRYEVCRSLLYRWRRPKRGRMSEVIALKRPMQSEIAQVMES